MCRIPMLLALLVPVTLPCAQRQFSSSLREYLPPLNGGLMAATFGDLDGDADLDLVLANQDGVRLWLNDGLGRFTDETAIRLPALAQRFVAILTLDADRDGDRDLFLVGADFQSRLLLNDGSGRFQDVTATHLPALVAYMLSAAAGDVDGDGDDDVLLGLNGSSRNRLWLNDGSGHFTDGTLGRLPPLLTTTRGLFLADLDRDLDLDLALGDVFAGARIWLNDGTGRFTDATFQSLPLLPQSGWIAVADVNRDGSPDLWIGGVAPVGDRLLMNNGSGRFTDETSLRLPAQTGSSGLICLRDFDGDGAVDAWLGKNAAGERLYLNDGSGHFADVTGSRLPGSPMATVAFAAGDADGSGNTDLLLGGYSGPPWILFNDGSARFVNGALARLPAKLTFSETTDAVAAADLDGDNSPDAVLAFSRGGSGPYRIALLRNDGSGVLADSSQGLPFTLQGEAASLPIGDLDGDGDLDLVVAVWQDTARIFRNDGTGRFTEPAPGALPWMTASDGKLVDVDGDRDLDLVFACGSGLPRLFRNDGLGNFTDVSGTQMPQVPGDRIAAGDIDGDGDLDLVLTDVDARNLVFINDGRGFFADDSAARLPVTANSSYAVGLADIDGDGDLDLAFGTLYQNQDRLYRNDGRGVFTDVTATHMPADQDGTYSLAFGDLDGDGRPDLVIGADARSRILLNDGTGRFADATSSRLEDLVTGTRALALAAFTGSGAPDILFGNRSADLLCVNRLHYVSAPVLPRLGRGYVFQFSARPGFATGGELMSPYLSALRAPVPIPLPPVGLWKLDPSAMISLPWVPIPAPGGFASLRVTIPSDAALHNAVFYLQALVVQPPGPASWRFTNLLRDQILR